LEEHQKLVGNKNPVKLGRTEKTFVLGIKKNFFNTKNMLLLMLYTINDLYFSPANHLIVADGIIIENGITPKQDTQEAGQ